MAKLKREFSIYFGILITFALLIHGQNLFINFDKALSNPSKFMHPFIYTLLIYGVLLLIRFIFKEFYNLVVKKVIRR